MASRTTKAVVYGFSVLFICCLHLHLHLHLLGAGGTNTHGWHWQHGLAETVFVPSVLATLALTPLLLYAHVGALGRANDDAGGRRRLVAGLAKATVLAATLALLACALLLLGASTGAVVQIGADGHLDRGRGDVARLNIK